MRRILICATNIAISQRNEVAGAELKLDRRGHLALLSTTFFSQWILGLLLP
jgi:hypothetical protein